MTLISEFFAYARERHAIHLRRAAGQPPPWTEDPILQRYRFCQVFRELDRTTTWFRENVRERLRETPEVLLAIVLFRLFNRIATGEAIFCQQDLADRRTAWKIFLARGDVDVLRSAVLAYCRRGPYVTGSFMVKTPTGMPKLDGVLWIVEQFMGAALVDAVSWRSAAEEMLKYPQSWSLQRAWEYMRKFPFIGDFQAYEIVTDLRHTALLDRAPDVMTWANPGPGAKRGIDWIFGTTPSGRRLERMRELLELSWNDPKLWPTYAPLAGVPIGEWPSWEMREVEHTLCEFDKYWRVQHGGAAPRQRMRYA